MVHLCNNGPDVGRQQFTLGWRPTKTHPCCADWDIPMSPMLKRRPDGRTLIVVSTKPGDFLGLDAAQGGAPVWRMNVVSAPPVPAGEGNRGTAWGGALDDDNAYFGLNADGIAAVSLTDGMRAWYTPLNATADKKITHSAAATVIPGVVFIGGSDGRLWALSSRDGRSLWSYETAHAFDTVNAVPAHGGSMIAPGPTVAGGMVLVGSGYGVVAESPGNVLLAFAVPSMNWIACSTIIERR